MIKYEQEDSLVRLILHRPERTNSLVPQLLEDLLIHLEKICHDRNIRLVMIESSGNHFSTGGDIASLLDHQDEIRDYSARLIGLLHQIMITMMEMPQPVIVLAKGWVNGGSLGFLLAADIVVAAETLKIAPYYSPVGFSPAGGWTILLPTVIGRKRAALVQFTNDVIHARQAEEWGLVNRIVADDQLQKEGIKLAHSMLNMVQSSLRSTKILLNQDIEKIRKHLNLERETFLEQIQSPEALEGIRQFLEKREQ